MIKLFHHKPARGQTSIEYLLLLAVVAVVVIAGFSKNSIIDQVQSSAQGYYNTVTRVIMDSDGRTANGADMDNPLPINGKWCAVNCPPPGNSGPTIMYAACECPAPAFGGTYCSGSSAVTCNGVTACGPCPVGEVCNASGACICQNPIDCSGVPNSSQNCATQQCDCNAGSTWNTTKSACVYCTADTTTNPPTCTKPGSGTQCSDYQCPNNMYCNASKNACACDQYAYWNGSSCSYCTATGSGSTAQCYASTDGLTCSKVTCGTNMYCNAAVNACQCIAGYGWNGTGCSADSCETMPASAHATYCAAPPNPAPTAVNVPYTLVTTCDTTTACEAKCSAGYLLNGGVCVPSTCSTFTHTFTGTDPYVAGKTVSTTVTVATTADGTSVSVSCGPPTNSNKAGSKVCWEGDVLDSCGWGTWGTMSGTCTPETCTKECTTAKTADTPLCTVTFPAGVGAGTQMTEYCPSNCSGGPATDTCSGGSATGWGTPAGPACLENCSAKTVGTGACAVTLPAGTTSGTTPSESCPSGCTGGPVTSLCTNGTWGTVSGSCLAECPAKTVGTAPCAVTLPAGTASGTTPSETCPADSCTGGPVKALCTNGTWGTVSGSCLADCTAETVGTAPCGVSLDGTTSGSTSTGSCPEGCTGGPVSAKCTNGKWGTATGTCAANCAGKTVGTGACAVNLPDGTDSGTTVSETCPTGCSKGGPLKEKCTNGTWSLVSGTCHT